LAPKQLKYVPLVIEGWCRYLMGINDNGNTMELSPDHLLDELKKYVTNVKLGTKELVEDDLKPILINEEIFGVNLYSIGLGEKIVQGICYENSKTYFAFNER